MTREYKDDDVVGGTGCCPVHFFDLSEKVQRYINEGQSAKERIAALEAENAELAELYDECLDHYMERGL